MKNAGIMPAFFVRLHLGGAAPVVAALQFRRVISRVEPTCPERPIFNRILASGLICRSLFARLESQPLPVALSYATRTPLLYPP